MANPARYIWMDDELKSSSEGVVPALNAGLHYGFGVFEGIRCYATPDGPAIFRLAEHVERLLSSAHILGLRDLPFTQKGVIDAVLKTVAANKFSACYIRPLIYLDGGMNMSVDSGRPRLIIAAWEWANFLGKEARELGIRANVSSFTRLHPNIAMTKAKVSGNYVGSMLAKAESQRAGFDEAIMLDAQGYVAECTGENIFMVRRGTIYTVPRASILEGLTRESLIAIAEDMGYAVIEEPISRDQLYLADEVFVCGTAAEVIGLREIDFRTIGHGKTGPVTRELQEAFEQLTSGRHPRSKQWLSPVPAFDPELTKA
jgi:branched-chain amino acid aminotransferase